MKRLDDGPSLEATAPAGPGNGPSPDSEDPRVTRAVEDYLAAVRAGRPPQREAFLTGHPEIAKELAECLDGLEFLREAAPKLQRRALTAADLPDAPPASPLGDYRIVGELGRGGMGVVYEAEQLSLARRVALKVLPFAAALDPKQLQRFRNEALAAAHLNHPHIVPVYAVGSERGVHYYAMQLIDGQSLADLIRDLRRRNSGMTNDGMTNDERSPNAEARMGETDAAATATEVRPSGFGFLSSFVIRHSSFVHAVARLGVQAAEALEHAHQLGVVHRDVKPANLLVDARGHLWVTDFGLAQFRSDAGLTLTGDLVGTLRYMAPEQARAKHDLVDHRADVYALGVTLYELLTLRPACDGRDRAEVLRQVLTEEPVRPRRLNAAVPADLETVVLKAMDKESEGRYATAQELADDLRRFLEDRPVAARRPGLARRAAKWARRHRPVVASAAAALLLSVAVLAVSLVSVSAEQAEAAKQRDLARRVVDDMYTDVAERWLEQEPQMEEVQRQFLLKALRYYEELAGAQGNDAEARWGAAMAYRRAGDIQRKLEASADAEQAYGRAIDLLGRLAAENPGRPAYGDALAGCYHGLGRLYGKAKRTAEAERAYRRVIALREDLLDKAPDSVDYRYDLAVTLNDLGRVLQFTGREPDAEAAYRRALDLLNGLSARAPPTAAYENRLGAILYHLTELRGVRADTAQTRRILERAIGHQRSALKLRPRHPDYRQDLAAQLARLGATLARLGETPGAEEAFTQSVAVWEQLADDFPKTPAHRAELAAALNGLADLLHGRGRRREADGAYARVVALRGRLAEEFPDVPGFGRDLAWFLAVCPAERFRDGAQAVAHGRRAVERAPQGGDCWRALGAARCRVGDWQGAVAALEKAMELRSGGDGREWLFLALAQGRLGDRPKARAWYDRARAWAEEICPESATIRGLQSEVEAVLGRAERPPN
jgi:eukaryotic-like serine/threonine-protein kinase